MNKDTSKKSFVEELMSMDKTDIENLISYRGKPPKPIRPAFILRK